MSHSTSVARTIALATVDLAETFDLNGAEISQATNIVAFPSCRTSSAPTAPTLAECVPLLSLTLELIDRAPAALSIHSVDAYRADAMRLLKQVQPALEAWTGVTLREWAGKAFPNADLDDVVDRMTDSFEQVARSLAVTPDRKRTVAMPCPTLAECIPLLAVAVEFVDRGPAALTIDGVEHYRASTLRLLEHIRPAVEHEAGRILASWTRNLYDDAADEALAA